MLMGGTLENHLKKVNQSADEMYDALISQMKTRDGAAERLKANNRLE